MSGGSDPEIAALRVGPLAAATSRSPLAPGLSALDIAVAGGRRLARQGLGQANGPVCRISQEQAMERAVNHLMRYSASRSAFRRAIGIPEAAIFKTADASACCRPLTSMNAGARGPGARRHAAYIPWRSGGLAGGGTVRRASARSRPWPATATRDHTSQPAPMASRSGLAAMHASIMATELTHG